MDDLDLFYFFCGVIGGTPAGIALGILIYTKYCDAIDRFLDRIL